MPTFETPEPITVVLQLASGRAVIEAGDRAETTVETDSADRYSVEFSGGRLVVTGPDGAMASRRATDEVRLAVPTGSHLETESAAGEVRATGRLGEVRAQSAEGATHLDETGDLTVDTSSGAVSVTRVHGNALVNGSASQVRLGEISGSVTARTASGDIKIAGVTGDANLTSAGGSITVDRADSSVAARSSDGDIRVGQVAVGYSELLTSTGTIEVGVAVGSAAWIDGQSRSGSVHNSLAEQDGPDQFASSVKVHARTRSGDIMVRRAA